MVRLAEPAPTACVERCFQPDALAVQLGVSREVVDDAIARYVETGGAEGLGPVSRPTTAVVLVPEWAVNRWLAAMGRAGREDAVVEEHLQPGALAARLGVSIEVVRAAMARWDASSPQRREGLGPRVRLSAKITLIPASAVKAWLARGLIGAAA